jgi:protein arginine kinase activator
MHLCESCAEEKGLNLFSVPSPFPILNLLSGILGTEVLPKKKEEERCSSCGITLSDFRKKGKLGCSDCWKSFKKPLLSIVKEIHGSTSHIGKSPEEFAEKAEIRKEIAVLKERLKKAISAEEYEEAAKIRDRIKEIEGA